MKLALLAALASALMVISMVTYMRGHSRRSYSSPGMSLGDYRALLEGDEGIQMKEGHS